MARRILNKSEAHQFSRAVTEALGRLNITHEMLALSCAEEGVTIAYVKSIIVGAAVYESDRLRAVAAALGLNLPDVDVDGVNHHDR